MSCQLLRSYKGIQPIKTAFAALKARLCHSAQALLYGTGKKHYLQNLTVGPEGWRAKPVELESDFFVRRTMYGDHRNA